jgi:predicted GNAT family acetyltransferase
LTKYKSYDILNESFIDEVKNLVREEFFNHYYLINIIAEVFERRAQFDEAYIVQDSLDSWIIGFSAFGNYLLYGKNWTESQVKISIKNIEESNIENGFHLAGTFDLLQEIKSKVSIENKVFKERIFYSCKELVQHNGNIDVNIGYGKMGYHQEITKMVCDYFEYEYKGTNNKEFSEILPQTYNQILNRTIWQITDSNEIIGFCSIIETTVGLPIVGSFFIKESHRKRGYGSELLNKGTQNLLKENSEVWLMSDMNDIGSNKIFVKLGYKPVYQTGDYIIHQKK